MEINNSKIMIKNLEYFAKKFHSDKGESHHGYTKHYEKHFSELKYKRVKILELGVGGYEFPDRGGSGLKMWSSYFENGKIYGCDIYDKSGIELPERTKIYQGSQNDGDFLLTMMDEIGNPDLIIDDASHINKLTIETFKHLFPWLKSGGIYVVEDVESSWWNTNGFDGEPNFLDMHAKTSINFCRELINCINAKHLPAEFSAESVYKIESMHFYQNIVFIVKK